MVARVLFLSLLLGNTIAPHPAGDPKGLCWRKRLVSSDCQSKPSGHGWFGRFLLPTPL